MEVPKYLIEALERIVSSETSSNGKRAVKMFEKLRKGNKVCLLNKVLYGLRQAGRCWNEKIDEELLKFRAKKSVADPCVYFKGSEKICS